MNEDQTLIDEALKVYKIDPEHLFHSRVDGDTGEAVIVTHGGKKLRHGKGNKAKCQLTETQITGRPPEQDLVWNERFNQRIDLKSLFLGKRKSKE